MVLRSFYIFDKKKNLASKLLEEAYRQK